MNARWKIALSSTISSVVVIALLVAAATFVHMRVECARVNALDNAIDSAKDDETCAKGCDGCVGWCNEKYTADEEMDANLDCHELCSKSYPQCWTGCLEREVDGMNATQAAIDGKTQKNARVCWMAPYFCQDAYNTCKRHCPRKWWKKAICYAKCAYSMSRCIAAIASCF